MRRWNSGSDPQVSLRAQSGAGTVQAQLCPVHHALVCTNSTTSVHSRRSRGLKALGLKSFSMIVALLLSSQIQVVDHRLPPLPPPSP